MNDIARVLVTASFAAHKHRNQRRKDADASPYITSIGTGAVPLVLAAPW